MSEVDDIMELLEEGINEPAQEVIEEFDSTPNEFSDSTYIPIGTSIQLSRLYYEIQKGISHIDSSMHLSTRVWGITFIKEGVETTYWVNEYWFHKLTEISLPKRSAAIPENSGSLLVDATTSRFSGAIWYNEIQRKTIILAGVGGIGSYVGFLLGRLKPYQLYMYDPDVVESANMSGQLYSRDDVGESKVDSLSHMISRYSEYNRVVVYKERFTEDSEPSRIMICGFDNMEARSVFFRKWLSYVLALPNEERSKCLFIDGRLAAEEFQVFCIQGNDERAIDEYKSKWLFSDREADETVCSYKQTTFMANMIASVMVNLFVNFVANECGPLFPRDVPFLTSYSADTMIFNVEM